MLYKTVYRDRKAKGEVCMAHTKQYKFIMFVKDNRPDIFRARASKV